MKAVTVRKIPPELAAAIGKSAEAEGLSTSRAILRLLAQATGVGAPKSRKVKRRDLGALAGRWTRAEASAFDKALAEQRRVDPEPWK